MGSHDAAAGGGFFFSTSATASVPRTVGPSSVYKRRGLNRWDLGQDKRESPGVKPFAVRDYGLSRGNVGGATMGEGFGFGGSRGLGDDKLNVDLGRLNIEGGKVGVKIVGDGNDCFGRNLEKELKRLNINVGDKVQSGDEFGRRAVDGGTLGGIAVAALPDQCHVLNVVAEMDRIVRRRGYVVVQDAVETMDKLGGDPAFAPLVGELVSG